MAQLNPANTTVQDICSAALKEAGALAVGQTALAEDLNDAWARLQWMLQEWERKRWLVYHLVQLSFTSTGAQSYTVGPNGDFNTGASSVRPAKIEDAFLRQLQNTAPNQVDYPLELLQSREDYNKIALKSMASFPGAIFYDAAWPLGVLYTYPVPSATIYAIHLSVLAQLPVSFATAATAFNLPYEYYNAILYNLALRLRPKYGIRTYNGDMVPGLAKDALNALRGANTQIARLSMPRELVRSGIYNIFSDSSY